MFPSPVIAIFDVGKTNKKLLLFDVAYHVVYQESTQFAETTDPDGFPCEDLDLLSSWINDRFKWLLAQTQYVVKAVNFSAYGASFVHLGKDGKPVAPLYNYLKPFPEDLQQQFYNAYGGEQAFATDTASPALGHLNSGMQLYWLKYCHREVFDRIEYALHLPQYLSSLITGSRCTDITSVGCHTNLWNFCKRDYHDWVEQEGVRQKFAPLYKCSDAIPFKLRNGRVIPVGIGLHDSSAALIPYLLHFQEPFVLLSTGTWCITLNPFNAQPLTASELQQDCLCYLTFEGAPVKASRLFAGYEHEQESKRIAAHFGVETDFYQHLKYDAALHAALDKNEELAGAAVIVNQLRQSRFGSRNLSGFVTAASAYHQLIADLVTLQVAATRLVLDGTAVKRIFVDGGFSKNEVYMHMLAAAFPGLEVYAASMAQATALGAALVLHPQWNTQPIPANLIELEYYHLLPNKVLS